MKGHPVFPYFLEKHLDIPTSPFSFTRTVTCETNNYHNHLLQTGFIECTEAIATSLIPVVTNFLRFVL